MGGQADGGGSAPREYLFGSFRLDVAFCQLWRDDTIVALTPKAFDTLLFLLRHRDQIVTKGRLMRAIWPDTFVSEDALTQNIWAIRRALGDDSEKQEFIATVPRRGYRFTAPVEERQSQGSDDDADESESSIHADLPLGSGERWRPPSQGEMSVFDAQAALHRSAAQSLPETPQVGRVENPRRRRGIYLIAGLAVLGISAVPLLTQVRIQSSSSDLASPIRFTQDSPRGTMLASGGVLSPDGRQLAFVVRDARSGETSLWVRSLDAAEPRPLAETTGAVRPFWSPDGAYLGFFADGRLKRVGLAGEPPRTLASIAGIWAPGASWGSGGQILFATSTRSGLFVVSASGGQPRPATTLETAAQEVAHRWPHFLPDGRHFLFTLVSAHPERSGVYAGSLDSTERIRLLDRSVSAAIYASPGYLLYSRNGLLMAHRFDASRLRLMGEPVIIEGNVTGPGLFSESLFSASTNGFLTFGGGRTPDRLVWMNRAGNELDTITMPAHNLSFSSDGRQVLGSPARGGGVWLLELDRGVATLILPQGNSAVWSPDGQKIAYTAERIVGRRGLYVKSLTGGEEEEVICEPDGWMSLNDWSPDGRYLVYVTATDETKQDLWLMPTQGDCRPIPYLRTPFNERQAQVSPDGTRLAYVSDESGTWEVYIDSFPTPGVKRRISIDGGAQPEWAQSGSELFYVALDYTLMAVDLDRDGPRRPRALFRTPILGNLANTRNNYAVTPDGDRFLVESSGYQPITVIFNWLSRL